MVSGWGIAVRLALAVALGAAIGAEREFRDKAAGVTTHALVSLGASLFALVSVDAFGGGTDPSRVAAQIVTGVGFLGAGAIIRSGVSVRGLTTAASLWVTAAVGTACGIGYLGPAVGAAVGAIGSLFLLRSLRAIVRRYRIREQDEIVITTAAGHDLSDVMQVLGQSALPVVNFQIRGQEENSTRVMSVIVRGASRPAVRRLVESLSAVPGVAEVEWED